MLLEKHELLVLDDDIRYTLFKDVIPARLVKVPVKLETV